jgi:hypothetical protein
MMVARKKTDVVQLSKIRMREELRRKLARDAARKGSTLNGEIVDRLEKSYQVDDRVELVKQFAHGLVPNFADPGNSFFGRERPLMDSWPVAAVAPENSAGKKTIALSARQDNPMSFHAENIPERDRRDSDIIDMLLSHNEASSHLLRAITLELATKPEWSSSKSGIADVAEAIRLHVHKSEMSAWKVERNK